jgi:small GTP-binding protein
METDFTYKTIIDGDSGVGKTTFILRYITNTFLADSKSTIGVQFATKPLDVNGSKVVLQLWDFAGEQRFRFLLDDYCKGARGYILAFDLTKPDTFKHLDEWFKLFKENMDKDAVGVLIGTKSDLGKLISQDQINEFADKNKLTYLETSSKNGTNVNKAFQMLSDWMVYKTNTT